MNTRLKLRGFLLGALIGLGSLGVLAQASAQPDPTAEQATLDAIVSELFNQTATAAPQIGQTQTLQAAFDNAQTATAVFSSTAQAAFQAAQTATQFAIATPTPTPLPDQVVSTQTLDLVAGVRGQNAYLAPDGETFAFVTPISVCLHRITGEEISCIPLDERLNGIDFSSVRWSPDSRYLVFHENFLIMLNEPDLWVADTQTRRVSNITDDQVEGSALSRDIPVDWDMAPVWTHDGRIAFLRYNRVNSGNSGGIYTIQPDGSGLEELVNLGAVESVPVYTFDISPDGQHIAFNWYRDDKRQEGLWLLNLQTNEEQLLMAANEQNEIPVLVSFSPDGQYVLSMDNRMGSINSVGRGAEGSGVRVLPVEGGTPILVDTEHVVYYAWWTPDGNGLAYLIQTMQEEEVSGLYLADFPGDEGERVLDGLLFPPTNNVMALMRWARNNTILLSVAPDYNVMVVQLGS